MIIKVPKLTNNSQNDQNWLTPINWTRRW